MEVKRITEKILGIICSSLRSKDEGLACYYFSILQGAFFEGLAAQASYEIHDKSHNLLKPFVAGVPK
jgi:hypothetical protein